MADQEREPGIIDRVKDALGMSEGSDEPEGHEPEQSARQAAEAEAGATGGVQPTDASPGGATAGIDREAGITGEEFGTTGAVAEGGGPTRMPGAPAGGGAGYDMAEDRPLGGDPEPGPTTGIGTEEDEDEELTSGGAMTNEQDFTKR